MDGWFPEVVRSLSMLSAHRDSAPWPCGKRCNRPWPAFESSARGCQDDESISRRSLARTSLALVLLAIASGMSLLVGMIGIYGVISYTVSQRTREVGIRL